jgi:hypothetical protein
MDNTSISSKSRNLCSYIDNDYRPINKKTFSFNKNKNKKTNKQAKKKGKKMKKKPTEVFASLILSKK